MSIYQYTKIANTSRLSDEIIASGLNTLSHIDTADNTLYINFTTELTTEQITILNSIITSHVLMTQEEIVDQKITLARQFGRQLMEQIAKENVLMGITQAGKTKVVADFGANLQNYLETGSLYAAIAEIDLLILLGLPLGLSPFVTSDRLLLYKNRIQAYLNS